MILLITYNKIDPSIPFESFQQAIQNSSVSWWHHLNDTWIIRTNYSINQVYNIISPNISTNDRLMIVEIKSNYQGWLNQDAWNWLKNEFDNDKGFIEKLLSI